MKCVIKKFPSVIDKVLSDIEGYQIYLVALTIATLMYSLTTTMFSVPTMFYTLCRYVVILLIGLKILFWDEYSFCELVLKLGIVGICFIVRYASGNTMIIIWSLLIVGACGVRFVDIIKVHTCIELIVLILAIFASLLGIITNLVYDTGTVERNSFGIIYPTDFAAHVFFIIISLLYLYREYVSVCMYLVLFVVMGFVYFYSYAKLDSICILFAIVVSFFLHLYYKNKVKYVYNKYRFIGRCGYDNVGIVSIVFTIVLMLVLSFEYDNINEFSNSYNGLGTFLDRLRLSKEAFGKYSVTLWGQRIDWIGGGGTIKTQSDYNFLDCSYFKCFYDYGIVFSVLLFVIIVVCCIRMKNDMYYQLFMIVLAINFMVSHHMLDIAYNVFFFVLFAKIEEPIVNNEIRRVRRI